MFCQHCGKEINDEAVICIHCGCAVKKQGCPTGQGKENKWLISLLLCLFLGYFGAHRFYTGHIGIGIAQLLTAGGCGIWTLIDLILILCKQFKTADGELLE